MPRRALLIFVAALLVVAGELAFVRAITGDAARWHLGQWLLPWLGIAVIVTVNSLRDGEDRYVSTRAWLVAQLFLSFAFVWILNMPFILDNPWPSLGLAAYLAALAFLEFKVLRLPRDRATHA